MQTNDEGFPGSVSLRVRLPSGKRTELTRRPHDKYRVTIWSVQAMCGYQAHGRTPMEAFRARLHHGVGGRYEPDLETHLHGLFRQARRSVVYGSATSSCVSDNGRAWRIEITRL